MYLTSKFHVNTHSSLWPLLCQMWFAHMISLATLQMNESNNMCEVWETAKTLFKRFRLHITPNYQLLTPTTLLCIWIFENKRWLHIARIPKVCWKVYYNQFWMKKINSFPGALLRNGYIIKRDTFTQIKDSPLYLNQINLDKINPNC